jgi:hypothetical protein
MGCEKGVHAEWVGMRHVHFMYRYFGSKNLVLYVEFNSCGYGDRDRWGFSERNGRFFFEDVWIVGHGC